MENYGMYFITIFRIPESPPDSIVQDVISNAYKKRGRGDKPTKRNKNAAKTIVYFQEQAEKRTVLPK